MNLQKWGLGDGGEDYLNILKYWKLKPKEIDKIPVNTYAASSEDALVVFIN